MDSRIEFWFRAEFKLFVKGTGYASAAASACMARRQSMNWRAAATRLSTLRQSKVPPFLAGYILLADAPLEDGYLGRAPPCFSVCMAHTLGMKNHAAPLLLKRYSLHRWSCPIGTSTFSMSNEIQVKKRFASSLRPIFFFKHRIPRAR